MDNKYSVYRDIRFKRTYRTLGKMSWWRVVLGVVLIIFVLFLSGVPSQLLASREEFRLAEKLIISPEWMENNKPETLEFIKAGVLYQDGKIEEAVTAFDKIENYDAAEIMKSRCMLKIASKNFESEHYDEAYNASILVEKNLLTEDEVKVYMDICNALYEHYKSLEVDHADTLMNIISA